MQSRNRPPITATPSFGLKLHTQADTTAGRNGLNQNHFLEDPKTTRTSETMMI